MFRFLIILLTCAAPGALLFLYLMWISKRFAPTQDELDAQTTQLNRSNVADEDLFEAEDLGHDRHNSSLARPRDKELAR